MGNIGEPLKLLCDYVAYGDDLEYITEERNKDEPITMYIQGPYLMAEQKNKNGRRYSLREMVDEVSRYTSHMIKENRSIGELNHPPSAEVNPERACHMITEFKQDGDIFLGKSKVLTSPLGTLVRGLIKDGVKLGISSRALGKLVPGSNDEHMVQGFHLICCDVVHDPSVSSAFVNGILESKQFIVECNGSICELYDRFEKNLERLPRKSDEKKLYLEKSVLDFIKLLKNS
jgi:hypothetical protein